MNHPAIVVIAYNREKALGRLLSSLRKAHYPGEAVQLVISIDKSDNPLVEQTAEDFSWPFGEKQVILREENMGLKAHVLTCGDLSDVYGSVILLEDDLYVSPEFYDYACSALDHTQAEPEIAGISLYNHLLNVHAREPFQALEDGSDGWYFQFASSWGQAFTRDQWQGFRSWMEKHDGEDIASPRVPVNVSSWSARSWLKYYIRYMIDEDLYFLYPAVSLTTNFSDEGTHSMGQAADLQVPLLQGKREWRFVPLAESASVYDAFFENRRLSEELESALRAAASSENGTGEKEGARPVVVDLYGCKPVPTAGYYLTNKVLPNAVVRSYGLCLRPIECNVMQEIPGGDLFLYDMGKTGKAPQADPMTRIFYNYRAFKAKYGLSVIRRRIRNRLTGGK